MTVTTMACSCPPSRAWSQAIQSLETVSLALLWTVEADVNTGPLPSAGATTELNQAVAAYYDTTIGLYEQLWGEHVHHGYWDPGESPRTGADRHAACDRTVRELI